jgi:acyl dehydratase
MAPTGLRHELVAFNTATASNNKIHDDEVARRYGFAGGLVPGVDVYAYLTHVPAARWGRAWLERGSISARFRQPVYDGDTVVVDGVEAGDGTIELTLHDSRGALCATATAGRVASDAAAPDRSERPTVDIPSEVPPASAESLAAGTVLGAVGKGFHAELAEEYLAAVREPLDLYRDDAIAHPGWLLRSANTLLAANVRLGPWIHVGSDVRFLDVVHDGEHVEARGHVVEEYERKGHRFVVLDVLLTADGRPVLHVAHTAIHTPRAVAPA